MSRSIANSYSAAERDDERAGREELTKSEYYLPISRREIIESGQLFATRLYLGRRYLTLASPPETQAFWVWYWWRKARQENYFANKAYNPKSVDLLLPVLIDVDREIIYVQPELCARTYKRIAFIDLSIEELVALFVIVSGVYLLVFRVWFRRPTAPTLLEQEGGLQETAPTTESNDAPQIQTDAPENFALLPKISVN